jgi:hypothetical protein
MAILTDEDPSKSNQPSAETGAAAAEVAASIAEDAARDLEKVEKMMGRQHMALYAFIGVFLAVLASAIAYLAGRQGPNPVASIPAKPVTVISPAAPPTPLTAAAAPQAASPVVTIPAPVAVVTQPPPVAPPPPVASKPAAPVQAAAPPPATVTAAPPALADVLANRMYLQVGSLDKNVAELLTQGLRIKGVPATIAPGINNTVARIIVGPFNTATEMGLVEKQLNGMGFQPFPRQFQPSELRPPAAENAAAITPAQAGPAAKAPPAAPIKR